MGGVGFPSLLLHRSSDGHQFVVPRAAVGWYGGGGLCVCACVFVCMCVCVCVLCDTCVCGGVFVCLLAWLLMCACLLACLTAGARSGKGGEEYVITSGGDDQSLSDFRFRLLRDGDNQVCMWICVCVMCVFWW